MAICQRRTDSCCMECFSVECNLFAGCDFLPFTGTLVTFSVSKVWAPCDYLQEAMASQDRLANLHNRQGSLQKSGGCAIPHIQVLWKQRSTDQCSRNVNVSVSTTSLNQKYFAIIFAFINLLYPVQRGVNLFELSWEKVSAQLQAATVGHARLVLSKQIEQIYTSL